MSYFNYEIENLDHTSIIGAKNILYVPYIKCCTKFYSLARPPLPRTSTLAFKHHPAIETGTRTTSFRSGNTFHDYRKLC